MSSESDVSSKTTRASGSRSRSGCQTCKQVSPPSIIGQNYTKGVDSSYMVPDSISILNYFKIRRVKCDERKPGCMRCEKFGRICDGYEKVTTSPTQAAPSKFTSSILVTRSRELLPWSLAPLEYPSSLSISIKFQDEQEERYFRLFYSETVTALSGGFESTLWNQIVLQACNDEPCILQCAVALAALDKSCKVRAVEGAKVASETHHRHALQQYGKALQGLGEVISRGNDSVRTALIASILIFCFENFHGDIRLALTTVQSAVELTHNWLIQNSGPRAPKGFSPALDIMEDELISAFARMEAHLLVWIKPHKPTTARLRIHGSLITEEFFLPQEFSSLHEASRAFGYMANRVHLNLELAPKYHRHNVEDGLIFRKTETLKEVRKWLAAFEPVLRRANTPEGDDTFVTAMTLKAHALVFELALGAACFDGPKAHLFDVFLPEYCEIVAICRDVAQHPRFIKRFVFEAGIVACLFAVITQCRDKMVRQEAMKVLREASPRREGCWDSLMVLRIGEELSKVEEGNDEVHVRAWVEMDLRCLSTTFELPQVRNGEEGVEPVRHNGRGYLLDWVERCMSGFYTVCGSTDYYEGCKSR